MNQSNPPAAWDEFNEMRLWVQHYSGFNCPVLEVGHAGKRIGFSYERGPSVVRGYCEAAHGICIFDSVDGSGSSRVYRNPKVAALEILERLQIPVV